MGKRVMPAGPTRARSNATFPVVGIGASAGGLEAFTQLLSELPKDTGMAFVLVQHLDPEHESALAEILSRVTPIPVSEAANDLAVEPDNVYVIPPNTTLNIAALLQAVAGIALQMADVDTVHVGRPHEMVTR